MKRSVGEHLVAEQEEVAIDKAIEYKLDSTDAQALATGVRPFEVYGRRVACAEILPGETEKSVATIRGIATVEAVDDTLTGDQRPDEVEKVAHLKISQPSRGERVFARFFGRQPQYSAHFLLREPYAGELDMLREQ